MKTKNRNEILKTIYIFFSCFCICTGFLLLFRTWFSLSFSEPALFLSVLICLLLVYIGSRKVFRSRLLFFLTVLIPIGGFLLYRSDIPLLVILPYAGMAVASLLLSILSYLAEKRLWLKSPLLLIQLSLLIFFSIKGFSLSKWSVCVILFSILLLLSEAAAYFSPAGTDKNILYLTPLFLAAVMLLQLLPAKQTPIRWTAVKEAAKSIEDMIDSLIINLSYIFSGNDDGYSISFAGYNNSQSSLNGSVFSSEKPQLTIQGAQTHGPLYLTGTIRNFYNGHGWEDHTLNSIAGEKNYQLQYEHFMSVLTQNGYSDSDIREFVFYYPYEIRYSGLKTDSLFHTTYTPKIILPEETRLAPSRNDNITLNRAKGIGFTYNIQVMEIDYSNEKIQQLFRNLGTDNAAFTASADLSDGYLEQYVYENYLLLPDTVPDRVYSLAGDITADCDNDYDRLKALEKYLSALTYTTTPPICPETEDVVDYFLFESKTGYCTYFATAMAVLGRCVNIPTRYVEGFISKGACRYNYHTLNLSGNNAHAWTEAYIKEVGWIPLEPTPGYYEAVSKTNFSSLSPSLVTSDRSAQMPPNQEPVAGSIQTAVQKGPAFSLEQGQVLLRVSAECIGIFLCICLLFGLLIAFRNFLRLKGYARKTSFEKMQYMLKKAFNFGKLYDIPMTDNDTLEAYAVRLNGCLDTPSASFLQICHLYQSIRFGNGSVTENDLRTMECYIVELKADYLSACSYRKKILYLVL